MKNLVLLLFITTILLGCSDEKKVNRSLHSKGGKWEIVSYERYFWSPTGSSLESSYWCSKCGTIEFKRDGSGTLTLSGPNNSSAVKFSYTTTDKILTLFVDNEGVIYKMTWNWEKDQLILTQDLAEAGFANVMTCKRK